MPLRIHAHCGMQTKIKNKAIIRWIKKERKRWLVCYLNAMFEAIKLPASISDLDSGLTDMDRNALSHFRRRWKKRISKWKGLKDGRLLRRLFCLLLICFDDWLIRSQGVFFGFFVYLWRKGKRFNCVAYLFCITNKMLFYF